MQGVRNKVANAPAARTDSQNPSPLQAGPVPGTWAGAPPAKGPGRLRRAGRAFVEDLPLYLLGLIAAGLLRLAFPSIGAWPVAWIALAPALAAARVRTGGRAFFIAWLFASISSYLNIGWLTTLVEFNPFIPVGIPLLAMAMGVQVGAQVWGAGLLRRRFGPVAGSLFAAAWWVGLEWARTLGPYTFPWAFLSQTQTPFTALLQIASVVGMFGISALLFLMNAWLAEFIPVEKWIAGAGDDARARPIMGAGGAIATACAVAAIALWGTSRIASLEATATEEANKAGTVLRVALLQTNILQKDKWDSYTERDPKRRREKQAEMESVLSKQLDSLGADESDDFDLVITPESAITAPYFKLNESMKREMGRHARELKAPILVGADDFRLYTKDGKVTTEMSEGINPETGRPWDYDNFVAAWLIPPSGSFDPNAVYHKIRLVPFGESAPWLDKIPGFADKITQVASFTPGEAPVVFRVDARTKFTLGEKPGQAESTDKTLAALERISPPQVRFAVEICFESIFAELHGRMARAGADLLVNTTNDAWYGRSSGPDQHFQFAIMRAVETGRPFLRCANTGHTAVLSPAGRVIERIAFYERGILRADVPVWPNAPQTIYTRMGDVFAVWSLIAGVLSVGVALLLGRRNGGAGGAAVAAPGNAPVASAGVGAGTAPGPTGPPAGS